MSIFGKNGKVKQEDQKEVILSLEDLQEVRLRAGVLQNKQRELAMISEGYRQFVDKLGPKYGISSTKYTINIDTGVITEESGDGQAN